MNHIKRILIIDDKKEIRNIYKKIFLKYEITVDEAPTVKLGISHMYRYQYDLILLDMNLDDDMNGLSFLDFMSRMMYMTPVIIVSNFIIGYAEKEFKFVLGHVEKPFTFKELIETIEEKMKTKLVKI